MSQQLSLLRILSGWEKVFSQPDLLHARSLLRAQVQPPLPNPFPSSEQRGQGFATTKQLKTFLVFLDRFFILSGAVLLLMTMT